MSSCGVFSMCVEWNVVVTLYSDKQKFFKAAICLSYGLQTMFWVYAISVTPVR